MTDRVPRSESRAEAGAGSDPNVRQGQALDAAAARAAVWPTLKRVFGHYLWPYRRVMAAAVGAMVLNSAATGVLPLMLRDSADRIFIGQDRLYLYLLPPLIVIVMVARSITDYVAKVNQGRLTQQFISDLRAELFERMTRADLAWLQSMHSGRYVSVFMSDVASVNNIASQAMTAVAQNGLQVVALVASMVYLDWQLSLMVLAVLPIGVILTREQRRRTKRSVRDAMTEIGSLGTLVSEMLTAIRVVKAYHQEDVEVDRARATIGRALKHSMRTVRARAMTGPIAETLGGIGIGAAIFYGGWRGIGGSMTLGEFMGFISAAMLCYQPFKALAGIANQMSEGAVAAARVFSIIDRVETVAERPGARPLPVTVGAVRFEHVGFAYGDGEPVLHDFDLTIPAGSRVALVGPSGAGKSTVINLLLRFYDPTSGRVLVDGADIREATLGSVRRASALLTQEPMLFDTSIRANILYGSPDAPPEAVEAAARAAAADGFIARLPQGYDTPVGEAGQFLSGGQRQRIAFARALLRDAPILLLDEPTSALDAESETVIQAGLDALAGRKTMIVIAHRLATIRRADLIVVMDRGRIVETGTHDALVAAGGLYRRLCDAQFATSPAPATPVVEPGAEPATGPETDPGAALKTDPETGESAA
jgi:subfamily B ATP-binding cassette protein MsbA